MLATQCFRNLLKFIKMPREGGCTAIEHMYLSQVLRECFYGVLIRNISLRHVAYREDLLKNSVPSHDDHVGGRPN
jgi:hypothetical protein